MMENKCTKHRTCKDVPCVFEYQLDDYGDLLCRLTTKDFKKCDSTNLYVPITDIAKKMNVKIDKDWLS